MIKFQSGCPATRYSEDIDLSIITDEPIGDILTEIRRAIDPWQYYFIKVKSCVKKSHLRAVRH